MVQRCVEKVFEPFRIPAPELNLDDYNIDQFYDWLEVSPEVLQSCGHIGEN